MLELQCLLLWVWFNTQVIFASLHGRLMADNMEAMRTLGLITAYFSSGSVLTGAGELPLCRPPYLWLINYISSYIKPDK